LLDRLYAGVALWRRRAAERRPDRRRRLARPVISIGNLSVGGTGKTPVVAAVAAWLIDHGERPAILSRGYKRSEALPGVVVVSDGHEVRAPLARAGDEPLMLARAVPGAIVCVAEDRHLAGVLAERALGASVHVLDDGFQHVGLARDLDVLVTSLGEIPQGRVLPRGRLREPAEAAARAHVLVVMGATAGEAASEARILGVGEACGGLRRVGEPRGVGRGLTPDGNGSSLDGRGLTLDGRGLTPDGNGPSGDGRGLTPNGNGVTQILLVAGIANPQRFADDVRGAGWHVVGQQWFGDHHPFTPADVSRIAARVSAAGADAVFTTDKDAVRFEGLGPLPFPLYQVPLTVAFDPPTVLVDRVATVLSARRDTRGPAWSGARGTPAPPISGHVSGGLP
jgi:tetraacyldisaccharide 4'-kinase